MRVIFTVLMLVWAEKFVVQVPKSTSESYLAATEIIHWIYSGCTMKIVNFQGFCQTKSWDLWWQVYAIASSDSTIKC